MTARAWVWKAVSSLEQVGEDKISLAFQDAEARRIASHYGWQIDKVLEVPGHSRSNEDIVGMLEDYQKAGIYAYHDLRRGWYDKSFDVLIAYSYDRLARSTTGIAWVIANTVQNGMKIYLIEDGGIITQEDYRFKMALGGVSVTSHMDTFVKKTKEAKKLLINKGLPTGGRISKSHKKVRDESGKIVQIALNEEQRPLYTAMANFLIEGVAWRKLGGLLAGLGFTTANGTEYPTAELYRMVHNVNAWGHTAGNHTQSYEFGNWVFDDTDTQGNPVKVPDGFHIARNTIEPMYTGQLALLLRSEMERRRILKGKASPQDTYRYAKLCICGECKRTMGALTNHERVRIGIRCTNGANHEGCSQNGVVKPETVLAFMDKLIRRLKKGEQVFNEDMPEFNQSSLLEKNIQDTLARIRQLISKQSTAPQNVQDLYQEEIARLSEQLEASRQSLKDISEKTTKQRHARQQREQALNEIDADTLWSLPDYRINQYLHRIFGGWKVICKDRQCTGLIFLPK